MDLGVSIRSSFIHDSKYHSDIQRPDNKYIDRTLIHLSHKPLEFSLPITMLFHKFSITAILTALVAAQDISQDDIPQQCAQVCAQVVTIARNCNNQNGTSGASFIDNAG